MGKKNRAVAWICATPYITQPPAMRRVAAGGARAHVAGATPEACLQKGNVDNRPLKPVSLDG